jgi:hypothetical protein
VVAVSSWWRSSSVSIEVASLRSRTWTPRLFPTKSQLQSIVASRRAQLSPSSQACTPSHIPNARGPRTTTRGGPSSAIAALRPIIDGPAIKTTLAQVGFEAFSSSPKELGDFIKVQLGKWEKMVNDAGIQPE